MDKIFYTKQKLVTCSIEKSNKHSLVQSQQQKDQKTCKLCSRLIEETPERRH